MERAFGRVCVCVCVCVCFMLFPQSPSMTGLMVADPLVSEVRQWNSCTLGLGPHRGKNSPLTFAKL